MTYAVQIHDYGFAAGVALLSCSQVECFGQAQSWTFEVWLDNSLDLHPIFTADDATLKAYLTKYIVPKLDAWIQANPSRSQNLVTAPFSTATVPADWQPYDRLAALMPRFVVVTPFGSFLAP